MTKFRFDVDDHNGDTSAWTLVFPTAVPPAALAAVATGLGLSPAPGPEERIDGVPAIAAKAAFGNAH